MEVRYLKTVPSSELYHHGIKGQRWGVRRFQNYDGTRKGAKKKNPQPQELSEDELKRKRNKKIAAAVAITSGVALTAAVAYVAHNQYVKEYVDKTINSDTLKRVSTNAEDISDTIERAYYSNNGNDDTKYKGAYGAQLWARSHLTLFGDKKDVYQKTFKAEDVKLASNKNARDTFMDLLNDKNFADQVHEQISAYKKGIDINGTADQKKLFKDPYKNAKTAYDAFNVTLSNPQNEAGTKFYEALKNKGYDAIRDRNDNIYSDFKAKSATIIFNGSKVTQTAVNKLSTDDINDAISDTRKIMEDEKIKKYLQYSIPAVASAGIAAGSTGYAYNDIKEKKNDNKKNKS